MAKHVYIVVGYINGNDGVEILSAFSDRHGAEQFVKECEEWDKLKPMYPQESKYPPVSTPPAQ
jgi:hypothetical protein